MEKQPLPSPEEWDPAPFFNHAEELTNNNFIAWHANLQRIFILHPCVKTMLKYKPLDYIKLCREWPHAAESDPTRLAYTRDTTAGENDRRLITSIGKYLSRHWPHVADHIRRDAQALFTPDLMTFVKERVEIIHAVEFGPRSCMASIHGSIPFKSTHKEMLGKYMISRDKADLPDLSLHPYYAYDPALDWSMAVRYGSGGTVDGRALCLKHGEKNVFVRAYRRHSTDPNGWSETDFALIEWLKTQGYAHESSWPIGAQLYAPEYDNMIRAPYVDGGRTIVEPTKDDDIVRFTLNTDDDDRLYVCEGTSGFAERYTGNGDDDEDRDDQIYCSYCEGCFHEDSIMSVGRLGSDSACENCVSNSFTFVRGSDRWSSYQEYYIHENDAESVEDTDYWIDPQYPPPDVCHTIDDEWQLKENCVLIGDDWYHKEDSEICYDIEGDCRLRTSCTLIDENWYALDSELIHHAEDGTYSLRQHDLV